MVNYLLATDEQKELANGAREILERELKPQIEVLEHADGGRGQYPLDVHEKLAAAAGTSGGSRNRENKNAGGDKSQQSHRDRSYKRKPVNHCGFGQKT